MKRFIAVFAAVVLTFAPNANSGEKEKPLTFEATMMGEMDDKEATEAGFRTYSFPYAHLGFTNLESSEGEKISVLYGDFKSPVQARRYFDWKLANVTQVKTHGHKKIRSGKSVGRRAEVLLKSAQTTWGVMWTDGATFRVVYASRLSTALEVEKQYGEDAS